MWMHHELDHQVISGPGLGYHGYIQKQEVHTMNTGIAMIGFALVLLSVAFMISP
jgi:hypothetical protein